MILGLAFAATEEAKKEIEPKKAEETDKKQDKRGLFGLGYGYGAYDGYGYGSLGHEGKQCNIMRKHFFPPLDTHSKINKDIFMEICRYCRY